MRLHRFFVDQPLQPANATSAAGAPAGAAKKIKIKNDDLIHQWRHVLRFQVGQELTLFDNSGWEFRAVLISLDARSAEVEILESRPGSEVSSPKISSQKPSVFLYLALAKRDSFEWTLEKGTELGVAGFVPVISERSEKKTVRIDRSQNILKEASEQSGRVTLPAISEPMTLEKSLEHVATLGHPSDSFALDPKGEPFDVEKYRSKKVGAHTGAAKSVNVFLGPEGGFSPNEIALFKERKIPIYSFSQQTLRAETASVAIASILLLDF